MADAALIPATAEVGVTNPTVADQAWFSRRPEGISFKVLALGLLVTAVVVWTSWTLNNHNESHLLTLQTEQAGEVLLAAVPSTETPLSSALEVAIASNGNPHQFDRLMSAYVGAARTFTSVSLWKLNGSGLHQVAVVAEAPQFATPAQARLSIELARRSPTFTVDKVFRGQRESLAYALWLPTSDRFAVYAEHLIPADRRSAVAKNSAFSDLYYAIYLGRSETPANLLTTSFSHPPTAGAFARTSVPFGNTVLTLVTAPSAELGGTLPGRLPWIFGGLGVALSVVAALTAEYLARRRRAAEHDAGEILRLYGELGALFGQQRTIAVTLQRALLPKETPEIAGMEVAVKYVPGGRGMEIGGDWYSVIALDDERFAFIVGDVSGRGLNAATVMAALRFTIRAYALEGFSPTAILEKCSGQLHLLTDGHFATVLVGVGNARTRSITLANAGHFNPLLIDGDTPAFLDTVVGVPLGVSGSGGYESVTLTLPPASTLIAFTDGLVEHRGESLDVGLKRLIEATRHTEDSLDLVLTRVVSDLTDDASEDDIAILGLRWKS